MVKCRLSTSLILLFLSSSLTGQKWKIGAGFLYNETYSPNTGITIIQDSSLLIAKSNRSGWSRLLQDDDLHAHLYIERVLETKTQYELSSSISYFKRYSDIRLGYFENGHFLTRVIPVSNATFISRLQFGFIPFNRLMVSVDLGMGLHFKKTISSGDDINDPILRETYEDAQHIGRSVSFNYHLRSSYKISKKIELAMFYDHSIGRIDRKIAINGILRTLSLKWQALGLTFIYAI